MNIRAVIVIVLATSSCRNLPFLSHHATSSTSGNADGDASDLLGAGGQSDAALDGASLHCVGGRRASKPRPVIGRIVAEEPVWAAATMRVV